MNPVAFIAFKALAGGLGVVAFALIAEVIRPKKAAGLFSAAPAIALASMIVTVLSKGSADTAESALGMVGGAAGMVVYCLVAARAVHRWGSLVGAAVALPAWFIVAGGIYFFMLR